jgi:hypothetical protein
MAVQEQRIPSDPNPHLGPSQGGDDESPPWEKKSPTNKTSAITADDLRSFTRNASLCTIGAYKLSTAQIEKMEFDWIPWSELSDVLGTLSGSDGQPGRTFEDKIYFNTGVGFYAAMTQLMYFVCGTESYDLRSRTFSALSPAATTDPEGSSRGRSTSTPGVDSPPGCCMRH